MAIATRSAFPFTGLAIRTIVAALWGVCLHLGHVLVELYLLIGVQDGAKGCDVLVAPLLHLRATGAHAGGITALPLGADVAALGALGFPLLPLLITQRLDPRLLIGAEIDAAEQHLLAATTRATPAILLCIAWAVRADTLRGRDTRSAERECESQGRDERVLSHRRLLNE
ncbi:MAG: hypothetical protein M3Z10_03015 [Gemmatimonadota bacterium]|nr:hypothetical protein [Gemmatimonadota bacterium]